MKRKNKIEIPQTEDFQSLIDWLALYTEASTALDNLQAVVNDHIAGVIKDTRKDYTRLQEQLVRAEAELERIARAHPEWFESKKSIKTPFGTVSFRKSTELLIENEQAVIARLEREAFRQFPGDGDDAILARETFMCRFTRAEISLNKEALESEEDAFLKTIGIARVPKDNFSAKPAALDMGQAFKESLPEEQAAAAA